jgi:hypothetical protein
MATISEEQLADKIEAAMDLFSDEPEINIAEARKHLAKEIAEGVKMFVVGRETTVTGTSATGGPVTGTGVIKATP